MNMSLMNLRRLRGATTVIPLKEYAVEIHPNGDRILRHEDSGALIPVSKITATWELIDKILELQELTNDSC